MRCPNCDDDFEFTWPRYVTSGNGRFPCPTCGARLQGRHRWFYWVVMPGAVLAAMMLAATISALFLGEAGSLIVAVVAGLAVGLPVDRYMEARFGVIVLDPRAPSNKGIEQNARR